MQDVIDRLRASKQKDDATKREEALDDGRMWARNHADYGELEALEAAFANPANRYEDDPNSPYSPGELLYFTICLEQDGDHDAADAFWNGLIPDAKHLAGSTAWVNGFIDGALEVWEEVKGHIQ